MLAINVMSALAQPTRLAVFTRLARVGCDGLTAGQLAADTGTPANTMSAHLNILSQAGLVASRRAGRNIFYRAIPDAIRHLATFLVRDCCDAMPEVVAPLVKDLQAPRARREKSSAAE